MTARRFAALVLLPIAIAAGCNGAAPMTPSEKAGSIGTPGDLSSASEMTGVVRGEDGVPLDAATITLNFQVSSASGLRPDVSATTNAAGEYTLRFTPVSSSATPMALAYVRTAECTAPGEPVCRHDPDYRYINSTKPLVQDFRLHRISTITAGQSTVLTVAHDDAICVNNVQDMHPWLEEFVCRTVRVVAPTDGVMTIEAVAVDAGSPFPGLEVETAGGDGVCCSERLGNPSSLLVTRGTVVKASVEVPLGTAGAHSFAVKTSMAAK